MANKKAQGLPLNLIVLAAIAALILVLIIAFTIGGAGAFFSKIFRGGTTAIGDEIDTVRTTCNSLCSQAQTISSAGAWDGTSFCTRTFNIDIDKDGKIGGTTNPADPTAIKAYNSAKPAQKEKGIKCHEAPINAKCSVDVSTPTGAIICDETMCKDGCAQTT